jgi:hypothetical protein
MSGPPDIIALIADAVAEKLRPMLAADRPSDFIDRKTCPCSKRWWDRSRGKLFPTFRDGRRLVAKRADVIAALERETRFTPKPEPLPAPKDEDEALLAAAGVRLAGAR